MRPGVGLAVLLVLLVLSLVIGYVLRIVLGASYFPPALARTMFSYDVIAVVGSLVVVAVMSLGAKLLD